MVARHRPESVAGMTREPVADTGVQDRRSTGRRRWRSSRFSTKIVFSLSRVEVWSHVVNRLRTQIFGYIPAGERIRTFDLLITNQTADRIRSTTCAASLLVRKMCAARMLIHNGFLVRC